MSSHNIPRASSDDCYSCAASTYILPSANTSGNYSQAINEIPTANSAVQAVQNPVPSESSGFSSPSASIYTPSTTPSRSLKPFESLHVIWDSTKMIVGGPDPRCFNPANQVDERAPLLPTHNARQFSIAPSSNESEPEEPLVIHYLSGTIHRDVNGEFPREVIRRHQRNDFVFLLTYILFWVWFGVLIWWAVSVDEKNGWNKGSHGHPTFTTAAIPNTKPVRFVDVGLALVAVFSIAVIAIMVLILWFHCLAKVISMWFLMFVLFCLGSLGL